MVRSTSGDSVLFLSANCISGLACILHVLDTVIPFATITQCFYSWMCGLICDCLSWKACDSLILTCETNSFVLVFGVAGSGQLYNSVCRGRARLTNNEKYILPRALIELA